MDNITPDKGFLGTKVGRSVFLTVVFYLACIVLVEILTFYVNFLTGIIVIALLILVAVNHSALSFKNELYWVLPVMMLLPLMRMTSIVLPIPGWPPQTWYILVAIPVLASAWLIKYTLKISLSDIGLQHSHWREQFLIALSGIPLGLIGYFFLHPEPLFKTSGFLSAVANLLIVLVFIAFVEEIVFRGILLHALTRISDWFAIFASTLLYGVAHAGAHSLVFALYMGLVGWLFARFSIRTRSIWGVIIANFLLTAGMGLFWPFYIK